MEKFLYTPQVIAGVVLLFFVIIVVFKKRPKAKKISIVENSVKVDKIELYHIKNIMRIIGRENYSKFDGYRKLKVEKENNDEEHLLIQLINHGVDRTSLEIFPRILHITSKGRIYWETDFGNKPIKSDTIEEYLKEEELMV